VWSFVAVKTAKYWLWTALCRRTRQIVAFVIGDHSAATCQRLWNKIPAAYRGYHTFSDFWDAYQKVFPTETHRSVGKDSGQTNHMERWNCTLRQKLARYVRKTLSFSKAVYMHHLVTRTDRIGHRIYRLCARSSCHFNRFPRPIAKTAELYFYES